MMKATKKRLWWGLGTGAALGVAGICASHATARYLVRLALEREAPKGMKRQRTKLRGGALGEDAERLLTEAAKRLEEKRPKRVELIGSDGARLVGHWLTCENPKRAVIAMHGWRSNWSRDFGSIADFWLENGCNVLFAEQRGQNDSAGEYMGFGLLERHDCRDWAYGAERETEGKLPIQLAGISMGATTVLMASGLELPRSVRGIMADCGFTSPGAIWKHVVERNLHVPFGLYAAAADGMCQKRIRMRPLEYSAVDALKVNRIPVLFIPGSDDRFVPVEMTYENYKSCAAPKRLFIVPGANHGMSYYLDREGYQRNTLEFWAETERGEKEADAWSPNVTENPKNEKIQ